MVFFVADNVYAKDDGMDLFEKERNKSVSEPLSMRMRPSSLEEFEGQEHILGEGKLLKRAIEADRISSLIFYGPPGTGKTALAEIISRRTGSRFFRTNAVYSNVKEIREIIDLARRNHEMKGQRSILLLDEIHRFNKAQQDVLMPSVEQGFTILIGTTTENPFFSVNAALISRSQIFEFKSLKEVDIEGILNRAIIDKDRGYGKLNLCVEKDAISHLARISGGDARKALNALELSVLTTKPGADGVVKVTLKEAEESIQKKAVIYDKKGDGHYDTVSAYIKSMRGSDPDAAIYWLAKMIVAGEDPMFIARRLVICASEDVGNADPRALMIANAAMQAADFVGFPEARIPLAQATIYVATAPKSNASYMAIDKAIHDVETERTQEVPDDLKGTGYSGAEKLGHGAGYKYAHDYDNHYVEQKYMPDRKKYYIPTEMGYEKKIKEWIAMLKKENA